MTGIKRFEKIKGKLSTAEKKLITDMPFHNQINLLSLPISSIRFKLVRLSILKPDIRKFHYDYI